MIPGIVAGRRGAPHPRGQWESTGSGNWVCPPGVRRVSIVLIGYGGMGLQFPGSRGSGGGGALTYKNDVIVVPGTAYPYSQGLAQPSVMFGLVANAGYPGRSGGAGRGGLKSFDGDPDASFSGAPGAAGTTATELLGGDAASYTEDSVWAYGRGTTSDGINGVSFTYGAGGSAVYSGTPRYPQNGVIRLIWGDGRSFPNNAR